MRVAVFGVAAGLLAACMALPGAARGQAPQVVTPPDWRGRPSPEDLADAFPKIAYELQISGRALIACQIDAMGLLRDCEVEGEAPKGLGFGVAALQLVPTFRMEPLRVANQGVAGGAVRIPISFRLPAADPAQFAPPKSPEGLALARRYVVASGNAEALEAEREIAAREVAAVRAAAVTPEVSAAAAAALRQATRASAADLREALARLYAARHPAARLAAMLRRAEAQSARRGDWDAAMEDLEEPYRTSLALRAGDIFCAQHACSAGRTPPMPLTVERR